MGLFHRSAPDRGHTMYSPMGNTNPWQPALLRSPTPLPGHALLRQRGGTVTRLSSSEFAHPGDLFRQVDLRRRLIQIHPQSIPSSDGLDVTITLSIGVRTVDPTRYATDSQRPDDEVYLAAQIALRELVASLPLAQVIGERLDLAPVLAATRVAGEAVGVEVSTVLLKDVSPPRGYSAALEEALVSGLRSETELERARNEVKTTRARLASAKVLEQNPVLAKIRMLEALPPGSTVEVRSSD